MTISVKPKHAIAVRVLVQRLLDAVVVGLGRVEQVDKQTLMLSVFDTPSSKQPSRYEIRVIKKHWGTK